MSGYTLASGVSKIIQTVRTTFPYLIIRLEARLQRLAEYWIYFAARFDCVYAFSYNSAESEPIWMKSGEL